MTANVDDDIFEFVEFLDALSVDFVEFWPLLVNHHALGPAEGLPNCFRDKWSEWMKHDQNLFKRRLEQGGIFPELFAFEEPVGILIPDEVIKEIAGFSKAVIFEEFLKFLVGLV